jgi:2-polyprenyl-3-methyl-5-hydroxy-6-metoxy-1,4-benzoquinol methylase
LIVVDNTPDSEKRTTDACTDPIIDTFVKCESVPTFDGLSHGKAINEGLKYVLSDIVGIIDSDYFILNNKIHDYVYKKFKEGYKAIGTEYNDGKDTKSWVAMNPKAFENIPVCFGAYYDTELARSHSWVITEQELNENRSTGFVEVGYRIRKHIFENNVKSENWKTDATDYGNCYFKNSDGETMGVHYVAGSHRRWNEASINEIKDIISLDTNGYKRLNNCLCCGSTRLEDILNLNNQPLANSYLNSKDEEEFTYPLGINFCMDCTHIQLTHVVDPDKLFKHYLYVSGTTKTLKDYFDWFVDFTSKYTEGKKVLDIACNDGTQLDSYKEKGFTTYGIDPAENLYPESSKKHSVVCDYFTSASQFDTKFDIITAQNVFAHNSYPKEFLEACKDALNNNGCIFIQTSQADMVKNNQFDTIYHEHISFFSVKSFCALAKRAGLNVIDVTRTHIHGTSFVFVLSKDLPDQSEKFIEQEETLTYRTMLKYANKCMSIAKETKAMVEALQRQGIKVIGYGAAAKGNTFLNFSKFNLDYIVDDNPLKHSLYSPGTKIPIVHPDTLYNETEEICVVPLAWNFFEEIKSKVLSRKSEKINFLKYFPEVVCTRQ